VKGVLAATRWSAVSDDQSGPRTEDVLQVARRALAKTNDLEDDVAELQADREDLRDKLTAVQLRLSEIDEERDYSALTLDEKVGKVREHAFNRAVDGHGKAMLDYNAIQWEVFDGEPGPNHCYKLLRLAAGLTDADEKRPTGGEIPGFRCRDPDGDNYHLAVDAERAKRGAAFYPGNKTAQEGGL